MPGRATPTGDVPCPDECGLAIKMYRKRLMTFDIDGPPSETLRRDAATDVDTGKLRLTPRNHGNYSRYKSV